MNHWDLFWFYLGRADVWYDQARIAQQIADASPGEYRYWNVRTIEHLAKARELEDQAFLHARKAMGL